MRLFRSKKSKEDNNSDLPQRKKKKVAINKTMTIKDCINFANENLICNLATVEEDQPRVRTMGFWFADDTGFYFQTSASKELVRQLEKNKNAEICFYKHEGVIGTMMRITGLIEFINDIKLKERVLKDRAFLKSFGLTIDSPDLIIFRIPHGEAHFWTMENNTKPKEFIEF